jgi:hypothetical protein
MTPSLELKLRTLALQNAQMVALFTGPQNAFLWFDRQLAQGDIAKPVQPVSSNPVYMGVKRVSSQRPCDNQGGVSPMAAVRLELTLASYSAENARQAAMAVVLFMNTISLCYAGAWGSPQTAPSQNPNHLLNERAGMLPQLQPPCYTEMQDWRVWNREDIPSN